MSNLLYRIINPPVRSLLRSPFHGLMSKNTLLLEFKGRKSNRALSTPISYYIKEKTAHCFTSQSFSWWKNLTNGQTVHLTIRGEKWKSEPYVEATNLPVLRAQLDLFLRAVPRDASHAGVSLDHNGMPAAEDILKAVPNMVYLQFPLEHINE